jgi:hypothetical protein
MDAGSNVMAWLLCMDIDNSPYEKGDVVDILAEFAGARDIFGKRPLDNIYHRVIHVPDMSFAKAQMYAGPQIGYGDTKDPLFNPNAKARAWKIDFSLLPAGKRGKLESPKVPIADRYDFVTNRYKAGAEDALVTDAEFEIAASLKEVIPA